jgi:hypothetical protein
MGGVKSELVSIILRKGVGGKQTEPLLGCCCGETEEFGIRWFVPGKKLTSDLQIAEDRLLPETEGPLKRTSSPEGLKKMLTFCVHA